MAEIGPPVNPSLPPPLHQLEWPVFERLTVDLFEKEDGVATAELHGLPGPQSDYGVDVIAHRHDGGVELASCKRYKKITAAQIAQWSLDMLQYRETYWAQYRVCKFVLATSAKNAADIKIHQQVEVEKRRFAGFGTSYELWSPRTFRHKLQPYRTLTSNYLSSWVEAICGPLEPSQIRFAQKATFVSEAVVAQLADLQSELSESAKERIAAALEDLRAGRLDIVRGLAASLHERNWSQLTQAAKAACLRLEGSLALQQNNLLEAEGLAKSARELDPAGELRLEARLAAERKGAEAGLAVLTAPISRAGRQLRASLLIASGRQTEASAAVEALLAEENDDPENLRLAALERLLAGDRDAALVLAAQAEVRAGHWIAIKRVAALSHYAAALSPALGSDWVLSPNPFERALARQDAAAQHHFSAALTKLDELLALRAEQPIDRIYRLAILASSDGKRSEAEALASQIIEGQPGSPMVVAWCLLQDFEVSLDASRAELRDAYQRGAGIDVVRVLGLLLAHDGDASAAAAFLEENLAAQSGESASEAQQWINRLRGNSLEGADAALAKAQRDGDWHEAAPILSAKLNTRPPDAAGLGMAELAGSVGRWDLLAEHIDDLLSFRTAIAVRLAVLAAYHSDDFATVLRVLDSQAGAFGATLPNDMRRVRSEALARSGEARQALLEAQALATASSTTGDRLLVAHHRARIGNIPGALPIIRQALESHELHVEAALQWSSLALPHDPQLAQRLFTEALDQGTEDHLATAMLDQAFRLGLDDEVAAIMPAVHRRAITEAQDVRTVDLDELRALLIEQREAAENADRQYRHGSLPIHMIAAHRPGILIHLTHGAPSSSGGLPPVLIRHGARPASVDVGVPWRDWHVHLDVTGLLMADRLGLLDRLEGHPHGIAVSAYLPAVLQQMQHGVRGIQPSRVKAVRAILRLIENGALVIAWSRSAEQRAVRLARVEDSTAPTIRAFVETLEREGHLAADEAARLLRVDDEACGEVSLGPEPPVLDRLVLERLHEATLLEHLANRLSLAVPAEDVLAMRREVAGFDEAERLAEIAATLATRVGRGIELGTCRLLPIADHAFEGDPQPLQIQLADIVSLTAIENGVVWADDRFLSGYPHAGTLPIVGCVEVLDALRSAGEIDAEQWHDARHRLRAMGAAFVPIEPEEVAAALNKTRILDNRVVETDELVAIRRAFASARLLEPSLKIGSVEETLQARPDEFEIARSFLRLFGEALQAVWATTEATDQERNARSDWLLENVAVLRLERTVPNVDQDEARTFMEAMQIAHCFDKAFDIGGVDDEHRTLREAYLRWAWQRLVAGRRADGELFIERLATHLIDLYRALLYQEPPRDEPDRTIHEILLARRAKGLPDPLRDRVVRSGIFTRTLRTRTWITVDETRFDPDRFWRAARQAFREGRAKLRTSDRKPVSMHRDGTRLRLDGAVQAYLPGALPAVLAAEDRFRPARAAELLATLELAQDETDAFEQRLNMVRSPSRFAEVFREAEELSAAERYRRLSTSLVQARGARIEELRPPPTKSLLAFFGLADDERPLSERLPAAMSVLCERAGPCEALHRLSGLPVSSNQLGLHDVSVDAIDFFRTAARTPTALVLAADLCRKHGREFDQAEALARLDATCSAWAPFLLETARWSFAWLLPDEVPLALRHSTRIALAWLHAGMIVALFMRHGIDPQSLAGALPSSDDFLPMADRLALRSLGPIDQSDPAGTEPVAFHFHAVSAFLGHCDEERLCAGKTVDEVKGRWIDAAGHLRADPALLLRRHDGDDALAGWLRTSPPLWTEVPNVTSTRDNLVVHALDSVAAEPDNFSHWRLLGALSIRGLAPEQARELCRQYDEHDPIGAALSSSDLHGLRFVLAVAGWTEPERFTARIAAAGHRANDLTPQTKQFDAMFEELAESCILAACRDPVQFDSALLANGVAALSAAWPATNSKFRTMFGNLVNGLRTTQWLEVWTASLTLRSRRD